VSGGTDYRLIFPDSPQWEVNEQPGVGYYFMVATEEPLDLSGFTYRTDVQRWDLSSVGETVYEDPYLAIDDYIAAIIPNWEVASYALDFLKYDVGEEYSFPRFLCYDCHSYRSYSSWNPYLYACTSFRIVIWDDPYFYPAYRYSGTRVVYPYLILNRPRYAVAARGPKEGWSPIVRFREAPSARTSVEYKEPQIARGASKAAPIRRPSSSAASPRNGVVRRSSATTQRPMGSATPTRPNSRASVLRRPARPSAPLGSGRVTRPRVSQSPRSSPAVAPERGRTQGRVTPRPTLQQPPRATSSRPANASSRPTPSPRSNGIGRRNAAPSSTARPRTSTVRPRPLARPSASPRPESNHEVLLNGRPMRVGRLTTAMSQWRACSRGDNSRSLSTLPPVVETRQ